MRGMLPPMFYMSRGGGEEGMRRALLLTMALCVGTVETGGFGR